MWNEQRCTTWWMKTYFHRCSVVVHATIKNVDHRIVELVLPTHLNHLQKHKLLKGQLFFGQHSYLLLDAHLLYVQAGDVQMDDASLQALHHTAALVMHEKVFHERCGKVTKAVCDNVGLQGFQEDAFSHHVLHQLRVQLVKQQVTAHICIYR